MSISINCPNCGKLLKVNESAAGKTGKCPGCGSGVKIPHPTKAPDDDFLGGMDAEAVEESGRQVDRPDQKPCPMCGEMIRKEARRCRFCGEDFDTPAAMSRPKKRKRSASVEDDEMTAADWFLCICCSNIGCIIGIVRLCQGKTRSGTTMIVVAIIMNIIGFVVGVAMELAKQR